MATVVIVAGTHWLWGCFLWSGSPRPPPTNNQSHSNSSIHDSQSRKRAISSQTKRLLASSVFSTLILSQSQSEQRSTENKRKRQTINKNTLTTISKASFPPFLPPQFLLIFAIALGNHYHLSLFLFSITICMCVQWSFYRFLVWFCFFIFRLIS